MLDIDRFRYPVLALYIAGSQPNAHWFIKPQDFYKFTNKITMKSLYLIATNLPC